MTLPFTIIALFVLTNATRATMPRTIAQFAQTQLAATTTILSIATVASASVAASSTSSAPSSSSSFYQRFRYEKPSDILLYLESLRLNEGDAKGVLRGLQQFSAYYPMYALSPAKAAILMNELKRTKPRSVLEIGTFFGYSALNMCTVLPSTSKLTCIEANQDNAAVARKVLQMGLGAQQGSSNSGSSDGRVSIIEGISTTVLQSNDALSAVAPFDFIFLDHDKDTYLKDLKLLEQRNLLTPDCTIVADNVIFPGAPGFLEYVTESNGGYRTRLMETPFERVGFETQWKEVKDAMSVSDRVPRVAQV